PQVQADAPSNQGRAGLSWLLSSCEPASLCALGAMPWPRLNIGSRVTREGHARFWERLGVQFPCATRQRLSSSSCGLKTVSAIPPIPGMTAMDRSTYAYGMVRPRSPFPPAYAGGEQIRSKEYAMPRPSTAAVATLGIDIGKNVGSTAAVSPSFYDFKSLSAVRFRPCRLSTATMAIRA